MTGTSEAQETEKEIETRLSQPIHTLLVEGESPILGIHWGADIFIDVPIGPELPDASVTLRRAKLKFHRKLGAKWQIKLTANYTSGGDLELSDNYLTYTGWENVLLKLGVASPQFSLESVSSSDGLTFMERAMVVAALSEHDGGGAHILKRTQNSIWHASLLVANPAQDGLSASGQAITLRYVHAPMSLKRTGDVNFGGSFSYRTNMDGSDTQYRSRPEIATSNTYLVDTGELDGAEKVMKIGTSANHVDGRRSWQTEIIAAKVDRGAASSLKFWGAYAYASYFLTNDSRNYNVAMGEFESLKVNNPVRHGGKGALELAMRLSYVDLTDDDVIGGKESNISLGLNWYLNNKIRFMANVVKVLDVDRPGSEFDGLKPWIVALRFQLVIN